MKRNLCVILFILYSIQSNAQLSIHNEDLRIEINNNLERDTLITLVYIKNVSNHFVYIINREGDMIGKITDEKLEDNFFYVFFGLIQPINFNHYPNQLMDLYIINPNDSLVCTFRTTVSGRVNNVFLFWFHIDYVLNRKQNKLFTFAEYRRSMRVLSLENIELGCINKIPVE